MTGRWLFQFPNAKGQRETSVAHSDYKSAKLFAPKITGLRIPNLAWREVHTCTCQSCHPRALLTQDGGADKEAESDAEECGESLQRKREKLVRHLRRTEPT